MEKYRQEVLKPLMDGVPFKGGLPALDNLPKNKNLLPDDLCFRPSIHQS